METFTDELELLKASYSPQELEFFVSSNSPFLRFCLDSNSSITLEIPNSYPEQIPHVSFSSKDITKSQRCEVEKEIRNFASSLIGNPMIMDIVNKTREITQAKIVAEKDSINKIPTILEEDNYLAVITIDHMRQKQKYTKTLISWTSELNIFGILLFCLKNIYLILESTKHNVKEFIVRLKTIPVDVDSSGKPCKEKMSKILFNDVLFESRMFESFAVLEFSTLKEMESYFVEKNLLKVYNILKG